MAPVSTVLYGPSEAHDLKDVQRMIPDGAHIEQNTLVNVAVTGSKIYLTTYMNSL